MMIRRRRHPGGDLIELMPRVDAEVGDIVVEKGTHRRVRGGQVVVLFLDGGEVLEVPGRLRDELVIDRAQARGQRL